MLILIIFTLYRCKLTPSLDIRFNGPYNYTEFYIIVKKTDGAPPRALFLLDGIKLK